MLAIDHTNIKYGRDALSVAQARLKKDGTLKGSILLKLIQRVLIFYLLLKLPKTSILSIFSKDFFNSSIFSREAILKIISKKNKQN